VVLQKSDPKVFKSEQNPGKNFVYGRKGPNPTESRLWTIGVFGSSFDAESRADSKYGLGFSQFGL
jgi:hypothetical protein